MVPLKPPARHTRRLVNGTVLLSAIRGGRGALTVKNGGSHDGVFYFTTGADYDRGARAFTRDCGFSRFDDPLRFRTVYSAGRVSWDNWTLTLNTVFGGNAGTSDVDPDAFPV
ncbi:hypothetical protein OG320_31300 [Microbispora sp. NBC_01189]|uniref:hypothetical protein n=1 Tax=Microbispora sp. NBC_01189 TaxID=2903583 RepID=UPI002E0D41A2|nr:hypothetical protein OG320_31300 [Microbispora sp. NBC_01189]